ncbi:MAG: hypothetical protein ISR76_02945 [Planctomycetes bacterium]|nr:hypothetical protein [Planctomycetota bacterium]MBL7007928.1 hypothetical protein [Planctomycetota bacterium]
MSNTTHPMPAAARPIGFLPARLSQGFARTLRQVRRDQPPIARQIHEQLLAAMLAEKEVRRLLARYRILQRRARAVLAFPRGAKAPQPRQQPGRRAS